VTALILLTPLFFIFEIWQLVISERYLGVKQIARGSDPRTLGLGEITAFCWSAAIVVYWIWMLLLLALPFARGPAAALLMVSMIGFSLRRGTSLKWVLVILTFEGALRLVSLAALVASAWRHLK
jgi:hypothetical protein